MVKEIEKCLTTLKNTLTGCVFRDYPQKISGEVGDYFCELERVKENQYNFHIKKTKNPY
jgi:hypothetical protein